LTGIVLIAEKGPSSAMEQQLSIRKTGLIACSAMEGRYSQSRTGSCHPGWNNV